MYSNPNDKYRIFLSRSVKSMSQLAGLPTAKDMAVEALKKKRAERAQEKADRLERRKMKAAIRAAKLIMKSRDRRRRPKGVSTEAFVMARLLKLTRTTKIKRKVP